METKELIVDDGLVEYKINGGKASVIFNPTDSAFVEKLFNTFSTLDKRQEAYKERVEKIADKREIFGVAREQDAEMRKLIDDTFGNPVCEPIFGSMNVYAMAGGLPVWANFLLAIMDEVDTTFAAQQKLTNPRIAKYTSKYHK